jgi:AraC-like DNA-binding protein
MRLSYHLPRADLRGHVRAYYLYETDGAAAQTMCAEMGNLRIVVAGGGDYLLPDGARTPCPDAALIGPTMAAYRFEARPGTRIFGAGVLPRGWGAVVGVDAEETADRAIDYLAVAGGGGRAFAAAVRAAADLADMAAVADLFIAQKIAAARDPDGFYPLVMERWLLDPADPGLDRLVAALDVSRRQADRISKRVFGASPKLLQRKYRALRAADRLLRSETAEWRDAAGDGFYDQSHFIKEFRTFVGVTPAAYAGAAAALIRTVQETRRRRILRHWEAAL